MKTKAIQLTAILMIFTASVFAQSSNNENKIWTSMTLAGENTVELRMMKPADAVVMVNVYDETHKRVYSKRITRQSNLLLSHDITSFPAGVYTYEVSKGKELVMETSIRKSSGEKLEYLPVNSVADSGKSE